MLQNGMLVCDDCKKNAIRAPEGATENTQYTCRDCLRKMPGSGSVDVDFNRRPVRAHGSRYGSGDIKWWNRQCADVRQKKANNSPAGNEITVPELKVLLAARGTPFEQAMRRGEKWAMAASLQRLCQLGEKQLQCLALVELAGIKAENVAGRMRVSMKFVLENVARAKRSLSNMQKTTTANNNIPKGLKSCNNTSQAIQ